MKILPCTYNYTVNNSKSGITKNSSPTFEGAKDINLLYVVNHRAQLLPERVLKFARSMVKNVVPERYPTLKDLHLKTYSDLFKCNTLKAAQKRFPEFENVQDISTLGLKRMKFVNDLAVAPEDLSLHLLQEYYGSLRTKEEIMSMLGIKSKQGLNSIFKKINFPVFPKNYRVLVESSDEAGNRQIAAKTKAWNQMHPDLVKKHNKKAAQGTKTAAYREAQSERIKKHYKEHPETKEKIAKFNRKVWERVPKLREVIKEAYRANSICCALSVKRSKGIPLTENEQRILSNFYKRIWQENPDLHQQYVQARRQVSSEWNKSGK